MTVSRILELVLFLTALQLGSTFVQINKCNEHIRVSYVLKRKVSPRSYFSRDSLPRSFTSLSAFREKMGIETRNNKVVRFQETKSGKNIIDDQVQFLSHPNEQLSTYVDNQRDARSPELVIAGTITAAVSILMASSYFQSQDIGPTDLVGAIQSALNDPSAVFSNVLQSVESMGALAPLYFGAVYTIAEVLAIPAVPLTASAGYLFGPVQGTCVVLVSASIAAAISFLIGRTFLRDYVERVLEEYPRFAKIDRAIGKEGFKLMLLLRLSPVFPFALSNYLYGASSIDFSAFFWGTLFGFAPGTLAYVYTGYIGKALTTDGTEAYPWFVYAGGLALLGGLLKVLADTATSVIEALDDEDTVS